MTIDKKPEAQAKGKQEARQTSNFQQIDKQFFVCE